MTRVPVSSAAYTPFTSPKVSKADLMCSNETPTAGPQLATYRFGLCSASPGFNRLNLGTPIYLLLFPTRVTALLMLSSFCYEKLS